MAKEKRASWFKLFLHQKPIIDAMEDAVVGKAIKAALSYFEDGTVNDLDPMSYILFASMQPFVDEAKEDYQKSVENGKKGGRRKSTEEPTIYEEEPALLPPF